MNAGESAGESTGEFAGVSAGKAGGEKTNVETEAARTVAFRHVAWGKVAAGVACVVAFALILPVYDHGLLFFLFALPPLFWAGIPPLVVGGAFLLTAALQQVQVTLALAPGGEVRVREGAREYALVLARVRAWRARARAIPPAGWVGLLTLAFFVHEIHFRKGRALVASTVLGPMLLASGALIVAGMLACVLVPRRELLVVTPRAFLHVPLPVRPSPAVVGLLARLQVATTAPPAPATPDTTPRATSQPRSTWGLPGIVLGGGLLVLGGILYVWPAAYFGAFTAPVALVLGTRLVSRRGRWHVTPWAAPAAAMESQVSPAVLATVLRPLELVALAYMATQALKYGFRWAWWAVPPFHLGYFLGGVLLLGALVAYWFAPVTRHAILGASGATLARVATPAPGKTSLGASLRHLRHDRRGLVTSVAFLLVPLASGLYLALGAHAVIL